MTGNKDKFSSLALNAKGFVTYGDNNKGSISGIGRIVTPKGVKKHKKKGLNWVTKNKSFFKIKSIKK